MIHSAHMVYTLSPTYVPPTKEIPKTADSKEKVPNPEYNIWFAKHQQVLNYLLSLLSREIMSQVATTTPTAAAAWAAIEGMFAAQSCARVNNTHMALATA